MSNPERVPVFKPARTLSGLPGYPFAELERRLAKMRAEGKPIYNLSIGDPDLPPPQFVLDAVKATLEEPRWHNYPSSRGDSRVRESVARWFKGRFGVTLDPETQVCILIGAKEGIANLARAVIDRGYVVAAPDPGYPVYSRAACQMLGGKLRQLPLHREKGFLPDLKLARDAKLLYLNYPNNPTGASAPDQFLLDVAELAESTPALTIAYDMAYAEMQFDQPSRSLLEFTRRAVEFHSLSKMCNATGMRVGFAVGDPDRIAALVKVKEEMDSGAPLPFQRALAAVLDAYDGPNPPAELAANKDVYHYRKQRLNWVLSHLEFEIYPSRATFYTWFRVGDDEMDFVNKALDLGVVFTPGRAFGACGKGWVRASVTTSDETLDKAGRILMEAFG